MNEKDLAIVSRVTVGVVAQAEAQTIALFRALFIALMKRGAFDRAEIAAIVEAASADLIPENSRSAIKSLRAWIAEPKKKFDA